MARNKENQQNIDKSDLTNYPDGRIQNNQGSGNGTPVNEIVYGDLHEFFAKLMRLYGIDYNGLPDNETNGYQLVNAVRALASKNDYILDLTSSAGVLQVPIKIGKLEDNESVILRATVAKGSETQINGTLDGTSKAVVFVGDFLQNEYVRMINTSTNVVLVRMVDAGNLDSFNSALNYLKAATQSQENTGTSNNVSTTPLTNKTVFSRRVNGVDSGDYLAIPTGVSGERDGLMPKDDLRNLRNLTSVTNTGFVTGINIGDGSPGDSRGVGGDFSAATISVDGAGASIINVTMSNAMQNTSYLVRMNIESPSNDFNNVVAYTPAFRPVSTTVFSLIIREAFTGTQAIKMHMEVVQL